jgi:hypothetical protein
MSVTYADRTKAYRAPELTEDEQQEIVPDPQARGPVTPGGFEPSDGELLARAER